MIKKIHCLIIIMLLAGILNSLSDIKMIDNAFSGIRIGVTALLVNEMIGIIKKSVTNKLQLYIVLISFVLVIVFKLSSIVAVMLAAIWAIASYVGKKK